MENEKKEQELNFTQSSIDADILEIMKQDDFKASLETEKGFKRYMLNAIAELLSVSHQLSKMMDTMVNVFTMVYAKPLSDYYNKAQDEFEREEKVQKTMNKVRMSHQKSKK